jgi:hypothetical protein
MTEESEHYMDHLKVHKSPATSSDPEPDIETNYKAWATQSNYHDLLYQSKARREISPSTRTTMIALRGTAAGRHTT